jgi:protein TonB
MIRVDDAQSRHQDLVVATLLPTPSPTSLPKPVQKKQELSKGSPVAPTAKPPSETKPPALTETPSPVVAASQTAAPAAPATVESPTPPQSTSTPNDASPSVVMPSAQAAYLNNPKPPYPSLSRRLNEQGVVVLRVFIDAEGKAQNTEISKSSGYTRLDDSARKTVATWRFVPGKRNGVPQAMWFNVPVNFLLE